MSRCNFSNENCSHPLNRIKGDYSDAYKDIALYAHCNLKNGCFPGTSDIPFDMWFAVGTTHVSGPCLAFVQYCINGVLTKYPHLKSRLEMSVSSCESLSSPELKPGSILAIFYNPIPMGLNAFRHVAIYGGDNAVYQQNAAFPVPDICHLEELVQGYNIDSGGIGNSIMYIINDYLV